MKQINNDSFKVAPHLQALRLVNNELTAITEYTFTGALNLLLLNLNANKIEIVSPMAFHSLPKLRFLSFQNNKITVLDKKTFEPLKNLMYLDLNGNRLSFIDPQLFIHNTHLSRLALRHNEFTEVEIELSTRRMEAISFEGRNLTVVKLR